MRAPRRPYRNVVALAVAALCLASAPAWASVKDATPAGFTIENTVDVPTDPETTWTALVNDVDAWWPADHTWWGKDSVLSIEPRAGGCFCEKNGKQQQALHMLVTMVDPGRLLRMTGGLGPLQGMGLHGALEFRLQPTATGTRVTMFYRAGGYTPDDLVKFARIVDQVQAIQLGGLAEFLRSKPAP
jgi:uncharacterized protein YndB with AHSA1/START domain